MAYNSSFNDMLKDAQVKKTEAPERVTVNCDDLKLNNGRVKFNKGLFYTSKAAFVLSTAGAAWYGLNGVATMIHPQFTFIDTLSYGAATLVCVGLARFTNKWNKNIKTNLLESQQVKVKTK